jgi:5,6-dimethylbenzimidazole synthase
VIKDIQTREKIRNSFLKEYKKSVEMLETDKKRKKKYQSLKLEGILESNINICITYDSTRFGPFIIGQLPYLTLEYTVFAAIQNLWLAARAEEVGVGWVSILSNKDLKNTIDSKTYKTNSLFVSWICFRI